MNVQGNTSSRNGKLACLVVEDSKFDQKMITRALSKKGDHLELYFSESLQQARDLLETVNFQIILLDNQLPDGMGADFALELSKDPRHCKKPIVMVSDWPSPFMWDKAQKAGVYFVLNKAEFHYDYVKQAMELAVRRLHKARV